MSFNKTIIIDSDYENSSVGSDAKHMNNQVQKLTMQLEQEISRRKLLEESLRNGNQEWKTTFDTLKESIIILDTNLEVVKANKAACNLLSTGHESIVGRKCYQLFVGSSSLCTKCPIDTVKRSGKRHEIEIERPFIGKTLHITCAPVLQGSELIGYTHSAIDISHQRNLEKHLVQAQKMEAIATLAGGIAHDFNNILGAIIGNADLLLYRLPDSFSEISCAPGQLSVEEAKDYVAAIQKASLRAKDLVSQILAFSRQTTTKSRDVIITPIVKEAVKLLKSSLPATIELHVELAEDIGHIFADPTQVHQVLMNLCTNAIDALENKHGRIEISLYEKTISPREKKPSINLKNGEHIVLSVRDNGIGMTGDIKKRIFDPFFTTREVGEGTGLGLSVLHGIVKAHGAVVDVSSEPARGSVFNVYFPKVTVQENRTDNVPLSSLPTGSETIIFVDDEEDIVNLHTGMLESIGYRVIPATCGEQVLLYLEDHLEKVDLIITGQTMPKMTGLELAEHIHVMRSDLPVILCSGYSELLCDKINQDVAINEFIAKPYTMSDLAVTIRQVFSGIK